MTGFTKLDNDILEEMARRKFNGTQYRILFAVWRYTYGFQREQHDLSLNFIAEATGIDRSRIKKDLNKLIECKVITVVQEASFNRTRVIAFNNKFDDWQVDHSGPSSSQGANPTTGAQIDYSTGGELDPTTGGESDPQERKTKEISKEKDDHVLKPVPYAEYEKLFGVPSPVLLDDFNFWMDESQLQDPEEIICEAIKRAKLQTPKNPRRYIKTIVDNWINLGLFTISAVQEYNAKFDSKTKKSKSKKPSLDEMFDKSKYNTRQVTQEEIEETQKMMADLPY